MVNGNRYEIDFNNINRNEYCYILLINNLMIFIHLVKTQILKANLKRRTKYKKKKERKVLSVKKIRLLEIFNDKNVIYKMFSIIQQKQLIKYSTLKIQLV